MYGLTSCGGINFTECSNDCSSRAQWWLAPQASIAITSAQASRGMRTSPCVAASSAEPAGGRWIADLRAPVTPTQEAEADKGGAENGQ
jgi:hypothetical protein